MILKFHNSVVKHVPDYFNGVTSGRGGRVTVIIIASVY